MRVAVIGTGLAGCAAAQSAAEAGAEVTLLGGRPGATAMWSGIAEVFGPIYDNVDHRDRVSGPHLAVSGRRPLEDRGARLQRLFRRRSYHPYAQLDLTLDQIEGVARRAAGSLRLPLRWAEAPAYVANVAGTARLADAADASVWPGRLRADRAYRVVGFEHCPAFCADAAAASLTAQGLDAQSLWLDIPGARLAPSSATASYELEALDEPALAALSDTLAKQSDNRITLVPPILGRTPTAHTRLAEALRDTGMTAMAELASTHQSLHGARLHQTLLETVDADPITLRRGRVTAVPTRARRVTAVTLDAGERIEVDALVVATGRAVGGGVRRRPPLTDSLLDLPLYLEGTPLPRVQHPPRLASPRLFEDHPLFRIGIGVSSRLQPLDRRAQPAHENLFAAGLVIGGTDFTRDGSAFGVGLVTGYMAGRFAAGAEA